MCAVVTAFGLDAALSCHPAERGVSKQWIEDWWQQHQRKDGIRKRTREANATPILHRMIEREKDIPASVADLESKVPVALRHSPHRCHVRTDRLLRERARREGIWLEVVRRDSLGMIPMKLRRRGTIIRTACVFFGLVVS